MRSPVFFYRIDGLGLTPGNKSAGFCVDMATDALHVLRATQMAAMDI